MDGATRRRQGKAGVLLILVPILHIYEEFQYAGLQQNCHSINSNCNKSYVPEILLNISLIEYVNKYTYRKSNEFILICQTYLLFPFLFFPYHLFHSYMLNPCIS